MSHTFDGKRWVQTQEDPEAEAHAAAMREIEEIERHAGLDPAEFVSPIKTKRQRNWSGLANKLTIVLACVVMLMGVFLRLDPMSTTFLFALAALPVFLMDTTEVVQDREEFRRKSEEVKVELDRAALDLSWNDRTLDAIREFQRSRGLIPDGILGRETKRALMEDPANIHAVFLPSTDLRWNTDTARLTTMDGTPVSARGRKLMHPVIGIETTVTDDDMRIAGRGDCECGWCDAITKVDAEILRSHSTPSHAMARPSWFRHIP